MCLGLENQKVSQKTPVMLGRGKCPRNWKEEGDRGTRRCLAGLPVTKARAGDMAQTMAYRVLM